MGITTEIHDGIAEVVMENPPVNALTVAGWYEVADQVTAAGRNLDVGAVVLRAEGRGFNAGVDIKEMQATEGFDALIGANKGCAAAFAAVY
jgi:enoyl-CoA hydratase